MSLKFDYQQLREEVGFHLKLALGGDRCFKFDSGRLAAGFLEGELNICQRMSLYYSLPQAMRMKFQCFFVHI